MANQLHLSLAGKIRRHIRMNAWAEGHHLTETSLQEVLEVSRGPIRAAMEELTRQGVLEKVKHRGFFIKDPNAESPDGGSTSEDEPIYLRIADDLLTHQLTETISETHLMRRYDVSRERLRRVLTRIAAEGWIERREGRGWSFVQLIDSIEAYRESYELRQMLEPSGILGDHFKLDQGILDRLTSQQEMVRDGGWRTLGQIELFETNSAFHEGIASMSGNRFLLGVVERQNQLRRLVEYRQTLRREQVRGQNEEHLTILSLLKDGERKDAAAALAAHLGNAKRRKSNNGIFDQISPRGTSV